MIRSCIFIFMFFVLLACDVKKQRNPEPSVSLMDNPNEIFGYYSEPKAEMMYSGIVSDSFQIFTSLPGEYHKDTSSTYPLLLVLDANAYFESVVAESKLGMLTQGLPKALIVGIGYKGFWAMDSLRDRDYTYPKALPEDSFRISGGAEKFKRFIDEELLPRTLKQLRVNKNQIVLMGHSLGGYFVLYYMFNSLENGERLIGNYISASPALSYYNQYLLSLERKLSSTGGTLPFKLYVSSGSAEHEPNKENLFLRLKSELEGPGFKQAKVRFVEFGNFDHMDSAIPGFMKGLVFVFEE